jgi:phospholipid transport system substrate-binding protein
MSVLRKLLPLLAVLLLAALPQAQAATNDPNGVVQGIADDLGKALEGRKEELRNDRDKLIKLIDGIVLPHFDIDYASILVLGQNAKSATPEQRTRFAKAFYNSIAHRYAEGLLNYTRGRINIAPYKGELNEKRSLVRTEVILDDGKRVPVDYAFRKTKDGEWKAYDVIIEGISYVTNYRNQVSAEIAKSSLDQLITRLETQGDKALDSLEKNAK